MALKGQGHSKFDPIHVVTQIGHAAYPSMRLDDTNALGLFPSPRLYLFLIRKL